ncbi:MAG: hypothetical protein GC179_15265 [Anaerolineaceae bacterium]|nr:hypothetical protein [Anaerolineaceae bacterium]
MSILGRDGNISVIRIGTIAVIIGILVILGGVAFFFIDRASHQRPYEIEPYPGAAVWYTKSLASNARQVVYRVQGVSVDDVAAYYQQKLEQIEGGNADPCLRFPSTGNYPSYDKGDKSGVPYRYSCMFDRSSFQISQSTRVNIEPGIEANNSVGMVVIENEQHWQR